MLRDVVAQWLRDVVAQWEGCGGSMEVHQTVKPEVPGSNPGISPTCRDMQFLVGEPAGLA